MGPPDVRKIQPRGAAGCEEDSATLGATDHEEEGATRGEGAGKEDAERKGTPAVRKKGAMRGAGRRSKKGCEWSNLAVFVRKNGSRRGYFERMVRAATRG